MEGVIFKKRKAMRTSRNLSVSAVVLSILMLSGCGGEDPKPLSIVGSWEVQSSQHYITVPGGITLVAYLVGLGLPQADAQEWATDLESGRAIDVSGMMEFTANGSYTREDDDSMESTGKWEMSSDNKTLTIDKGTNSEVISQVTTFTETELVIDMDFTKVLGFPKNTLQYHEVVTLKKL